MDILQTLAQNVQIILPENGLAQKLAQAQKENRPLIIKLGFDPTAADLHLGHAVVLKKLKEFQDLGHKIVIIVGSFTARIGDPTGKNKARQPLSVEAVAENAQTYINQLSKIIDINKAEIRFNSEWLDALPFSEVIQLMSKVTVAQLMHRNDFNKRYTENTPIAMHELVYPILQAFDSVQIKVDIEMGGTDQMFNCTMGRQLQEAFGVDTQIVMCMPILRGLDGKEKMSKSLGNIIGLTDAPNDMFGKIMSIPDALIEEYLALTTDFSSFEKGDMANQLKSGENPMKIKKLIAKNIIKQYHDETAAQAAEDFFAQQFQNKGFADKAFDIVSIATLSLPAESNALELAFQLKGGTKSEIRRLIQSGALQINGKKILDPFAPVLCQIGLKVKLGKRNFYEIGA